MEQLRNTCPSRFSNFLKLLFGDIISLYSSTLPLMLRMHSTFPKQVSQTDMDRRYETASWNSSSASSLSWLYNSQKQQAQLVCGADGLVVMLTNSSYTLFSSGFAAWSASLRKECRLTMIFARSRNRYFLRRSSR